MHGVVEHRLRTDNGYNLPAFHGMQTSGKYQIPVLEPCGVVPDDLIGFNSVLSTKQSLNAAVHFYIDDYQFERTWRNPDRYINMLTRFQSVLTPDFSLYMDMPEAMKIWNVYRSRFLGAYWQSHGLNVIPTLQWASEQSFDYCFDGLPHHSVVSVSTLGVIGDPQAERTWRTGMTEALHRIHPSLVLLYGKPLPEYEYEEDTIAYANHVIERMNNGR